MARSPDLGLWQRQVTDAVARQNQGHPVAAEKALLRLLRTVEASGDTSPEATTVRSRAHLSLAVTAFDQRGDLAAALEQIAIAEALAHEAHAAPALVAVLGQRAYLYLKSGDTTAALLEFDRAIELLDHAEPLDQGSILLNRGFLQLECGSLVEARRDLSRCVGLAVMTQDRVLEFMARHNLGYVEFLAGNLPRALAEMAAAAKVDSTYPRSVVLLDQARVLSVAGLISEADVALRAAGAIFRADRMPQGYAETQLVRAECALASSSPRAARALALDACRRFRRRSNVTWERKAEYLMLVADLALAGEVGSTRRLRGIALRAVQLADMCEQEDRAELARSARLVQADVLLTAGFPLPQARSRSWLTLGRKDTIATRLQVRHVRARAALAEGDGVRARSEVRRGLAEVSAYQARFGSLDMRTASAVHGVALANLDLEIAISSKRPRDVFASIERTRAASSRLPPVQPPHDDEAASLLAQLRQVEEEARGQEGSAGGTELSRLRTRAAELRSAVRAHAWRREGTRGAQEVHEAARIDVISARLGDVGCVMVSFVEHGGQWHAVLVDGKRVEHRVLCPVKTAEQLVRRVRADLDASALPLIPEQIRAAISDSLHADLGALDAMVLEPLGIEGRDLVVSPTGLLGIVPWGLLPSRGGLPVVVAPSATTWLRAADGAVTGAPSGRRRRLRVASVAGPGLTRADAEAGTIARTWSGTAMTGSGASTSGVIAALGTHDVVHVAAHGRHDAESPLFSSLRLADGPLFAHELDSTARMAPCIVLSACEVGLSTLRPGNEALGLTSVLLQLGARCVVAGVARVADDVAADVMERMHELMAAGADSATALARAQAMVGQAAAVAPFVCFGSSWAVPRVP